MAGNSLGGFSGCRDNGLRGRDGHFVAAPRMVLAAVSPERGDKPPCATRHGADVRLGKERASKKEGR